MAEHKSTVLLAHHLKQLKLPTMLREYSAVAAVCGRENRSFETFLLRLCERELVERQQQQHPNVLPRPVAAPGLYPATKGGELLRQLPIRQRPGMVQAARFAFQKRQIMHRIKDLLLPLPASLVAGDLPAAVIEEHRIHRRLENHRPVAILHRNGVVVRVEPDQGLARGRRRDVPARIEPVGRDRQARHAVFFQQLDLAERLAPQPPSHIRGAAGFQMGIQLGVIVHVRHRDQEVQSAVFDRTFHHALLVAPRDAAKVMIEEVMAFEFEKALSQFARIGAEDLRRFERARQLSAFAGLSPRQFESGTSVRKRTRMSEAGSKRVRKVLYMAACSAIAHPSARRSEYDSLKDNGENPWKASARSCEKYWSS